MYKSEDSILSPVEEVFMMLAKKLYRQPKLFFEGIMLEVNKYKPKVTEKEALAFELYWLKSAKRDLPHVFDFKNWIERSRTVNTVHEGFCRYNMCEDGSGYIGIVAINDGSPEVYRDDEVTRMGKYCPCKIGDRAYMTMRDSFFKLAKGQRCMS